MLKIRTKIGKSKVHGIGLFADQFIPKNTVTWKYEPKLDLSITQKILDSIDLYSKKYFLYYSYFDKKRKKFILCSDNQRFINHTVNKNKENIMSTPDIDVAARDIKVGEELLCDYNKFDDTYFKRMNIDNDKLF